MTDLTFAERSKELSRTSSRRKALKLLGAATAAGFVTLVTPGRAGAASPGQCRLAGHVCRQNSDCCSGFCDPSTATCACGPGTFECPSTGICVGPCPDGQVFNATTCQCECPSGTTTCGTACCATHETCCSGTCCPAGQVCAGGACCINPVTCTATSQCCTGFKCTGTAARPGVCQPCTNPTRCSARTPCCSGFVCAAGGICTPAVA